MSKRSNRISKIVGVLEKTGNASVKEMAQMFNVSEMTIRRDLETLQENHIINRRYGRASLSNEKITVEKLNRYQLSEEKNKQNEEKDRIGKFAAGLIDPGDIIIIDSGTTTEKLAQFLPDDMDVTVLCYNLSIVNELRKKNGVNIIMAGGYFHPQDESFESAQGINLIENIRATKVFISALGVHEKLGLTCASNYEVMTKRTVLNSALLKILLVDSSKFGKVRTAFFSQLDEIDIVVTDSGISKEWRNIIEQANIKLYVV